MLRWRQGVRRHDSIRNKMLEETPKILEKEKKLHERRLQQYVHLMKVESIMNMESEEKGGRQCGKGLKEERFGVG